MVLRLGYPISNVSIIQNKDYVQTIVSDTNEEIEVHLTIYVGRKDPQTVYQMAHEAVHCLFPTARMDTTYLEEGLAIEYALNTVGRIDRNYAERCRNGLISPWIEAYVAYQKLRPSAANIRSLRKATPYIDQVTIKQIETYLNASTEVASELHRRLPKTR